jgi:hypothetical protein
MQIYKDKSKKLNTKINENNNNLETIKGLNNEI